MARRTRTAALAIIAALGLLVVPAAAEDSDSTVSTFVITSDGALSINVPEGTDEAPVNLGSVELGELTFTTSDFGQVTVTDDRGALVANWGVTVTSTDFDLQDAGANPEEEDHHRVESGSIAYLANAPATPDTGTGVVASLPSTELSGGLADAVTFVGSGSNSVSWEPTLLFTLLANQVVGEYRGTITHSVS